MVTRPTFGAVKHPLLLTFLISLCAISGASAQTAPGGAEGFSALLGGNDIIVIDDSGRETKGELLRFTPENLTLAVKGREVAFDRQHVAAVYERTNGVKKGMILGLLSGPALGLAAAITGDADALVVLGAVVFSAIGFGVGTAVDAMIPGKRLVYERAGGPDNFDGQPAGGHVIVATNSGVETSGRLLRFTTDELTLSVNGSDRTFARHQITSILARGDSIKNGVTIGLLTGAATGFLTGVMKDDCDHTPVVGPAYFTPLDCYADEKIVQGLKQGALASLAGAGIGAVIDKLITGRRLVYGTQKDRAPVAISIVPSLAPSRIGVMTSVSW